MNAACKELSIIKYYKTRNRSLYAEFTISRRELTADGKEKFNRRIGRERTQGAQRRGVLTADGRGWKGRFNRSNGGELNREIRNTRNMAGALFDFLEEGIRGK